LGPLHCTGASSSLAMGIFQDLEVLKADLNKVTDGQGKKVLTQLFLTYFLFCKAMCRDWYLASAYPLWVNTLGTDTTTFDVLYPASRAPFGIKTLWGSLSDALPFGGYHKRFYILWGASVSTACITGMIYLYETCKPTEKDALGNNIYECGPTGPKGDKEYYYATILTLLYFGCEYGQATVDSLTQARYTELMKMMGTPTIVSFVWFLINSCTLMSAWGNLLLQEGSWGILLYLALPMAIPFLIPAALNWLAEEPAKTFCSPDCAKVTKHRGYFAMAMVLAVGAIGGTVLTVLFPKYNLTRGAYYASLAAIFFLMGYQVMPRKIADPALYMFLCSALRLFFPGSLQTFYIGRNTQQGIDACIAASASAGAQYTAAQCQELGMSHTWEDGTLPEYVCVPGGPGFPLWYYQFFGSLIGAAAGTVAVFIFEKVIVFWNVRAAFWVTTVFQMFSTMLEIAVLERWNHKMFGTDPKNDDDRMVDYSFFLLGTQAIEKIIDMLDFMPCNVLIGKLCPRGMEATIFAILAGSQNYGTQIAYVNGGIAMQLLEVKMGAAALSSGGCQNPEAFFGLRSLTFARICGGILLPAITIPLTFLLLPNRGLNDDFLDEDDGTELVEAGGAAPGQAEFGTEARQPSFAEMPRGISGISATSFISVASLSKPTPGNGGVFM